MNFGNKNMFTCNDKSHVIAKTEVIEQVLLIKEFLMQERKGPFFSRL